MAFWPTQPVAEAWADIPAALTWLGLDAAVWTALEAEVGPMGGSLRILALLPPAVVLAAVSAAQMAGPRGYTPVEAAQVGMMWNLARRLQA